MVMNLLGKIEGPVTLLLEKLGLVVDWQEEGGRSDGSLALVNSGFGRVCLGVLCNADGAGAKGFKGISEFFSGGFSGANLSEGASCLS